MGGSQGSGILLSQPSFPLQSQGEDSKVVLSSQGIRIFLSQPLFPSQIPREGAEIPEDQDATLPALHPLQIPKEGAEVVPRCQGIRILLS